MKRELVEALLERNILNKDTVFEAKYYGVIMGGVQTALMTENFNFISFIDGFLYLKKINTDSKHFVKPEHVLAIDGMAPERLAGIYDIKADGSKKKVKLDPLTGLPVRRGRKTNKVKELINDRLNSLEQRSSA